MKKKSIKVLIVDDSALFRTTLSQQLALDPFLEVVGTAIHTDDALAKIEALAPDVITLDIEMPGINGIAFLKSFLPNHPTPVIVVTSTAISALDALDAGAIDFVRKPDSQFTMPSFISELLVKIKIASMSKVRTSNHPVAPVGNLTSGHATDMVIAIGASTGGTEAILRVIEDLPSTTPGILVVQHMPPVFTKQYAQRLDKVCKMRVKEAEHMDRLVPGQVLIAAGEYHMRLHKDRLGYYVKSERGDKVSGHCPSVDVLFDSVADTANHSVGILLTGMGADGAKGLLRLKNQGSFTIGQDKESCVVYGMPMVAYNIGAVTKQVPLERISKELIAHLNSCK